jgi:hypothetical protein
LQRQPQGCHCRQSDARPEKEWPAELKDDLEARLCAMVCAGDLDVVAAQSEIAAGA